MINKEPAAPKGSEPPNSRHGQVSDMANGNSEHLFEMRSSPTAWPLLESMALHGFAGDVVNALDPYTEADRAAVLFNFLAMFGVYVGPSPRMVVDGAIHTARLFVTVIGDTSRARKSTATARIRRLFADVDEEWCDTAIRSGFASGEALIRDLAEAPDPRCLIVEPEFASVLARASRDGSILSPTMRNAWDGEPLANRRADRQATVVAKNHHVGVIAQCTVEELRRKLSETEQVNGFANRFLIVAARRSKRLPHAPSPPDALYQDLSRRIGDATAKAQDIGFMKRSADGAAAWEQIYHSIDDGVHGMYGALVARAEAQMLRLQMIYALLDGSPDITMEHVLAAAAAWAYAEQSVRWSFGDTIGDKIADKLYGFLLDAGDDGLTRTEQSNVLGRNVIAARLHTARQALSRRGLIRTERIRTGSGRSTTVDYACTN